MRTEPPRQSNGQDQSQRTSKLRPKSTPLKFRTEQHPIAFDPVTFVQLRRPAGNGAKAFRPFATRTCLGIRDGIPAFPAQGFRTARSKPVRRILSRCTQRLFRCPSLAQPCTDPVWVYSGDLRPPPHRIDFSPAFQQHRPAGTIDRAARHIPFPHRTGRDTQKLCPAVDCVCLSVMSNPDPLWHRKSPLSHLSFGSNVPCSISYRCLNHRKQSPKLP